MDFPRTSGPGMIDVALTRADLRAADIAVVVDVLRATSTATQALAAGYRSLLCAESVELALTLRGPGRVLAGERSCVAPPGFHQGNSPKEAMRRRGDELVLATTNGAPAIVAATRHAPVVLLACLLNLDAVIAALEGADVQVVCAGADGAVALEDVYVAGRICAGLRGPRTDAARVAEGVARAYPTPLAALAQSVGAEALRAADVAGDIADCAQESTLEAVGRVRDTAPGIASVVDANATVDRCRAPSFSA
jgi:2-phosphosulfolactate phosphatase